MPLTVLRDAPPARRPRRVLRRVLILLLVILVGAIGAGALVVRHYTDPELVRDLAEAYLQDHVTGRVRVGAAGVSWSGQIRLYDVVVGASRDPERRGRGAPTPDRAEAVLICPELELSHDPAALLSGRMDVKSIVARRPVFTIIRDETGRTNITDLLRAPSELSAIMPEGLPTVELRDARMRVLERTGSTDRVVDDLTLTIRAHRSADSDFVYDVVWTGRGRDEDGLSRIDLRTGTLSNVRGGLPWMSIEAVMFVVDVQYDGAGGWSELLGLDGSVRAEDYRIGPTSTPDRPRYVTVSLRDTSLSIPVNDEERPLGREDRYLAFHRTSGQIRVKEDELEADFTGLLHGATCEVKGSIRGGEGPIRTLDDVDFNVHLKVTDLTFPRDSVEEAPAEARFIRRWSELTRFFNDYKPQGKANLVLAASKRAGRDAPVEVSEGRLIVTAGAGNCRFFPYDVTDLTGEVEYNPQGIFIRDLRGRHGEGQVLVSGHADPVAPGSRIEIRISGTNVLIDEELRRALPPRYQKFLAHFDPQGRVDVQVVTGGPVYISEWRDAWRTDVSVSFQDLSARYDDFPYPLEHVSGRITAGEGGMTVSNVQARRGDARVGIDGTVAVEGTGVSALDLAIVATGVPFDDTLLASLPPVLTAEISAFHPVGTFDANAHIGFDPQKEEALVTTHAFLTGVTVVPDRLPLEIADIRGDVTVSGTGIRFAAVGGRRGAATLTVSGDYGLGDAPAPTDLQLAIDNIELTDDVRAALPAAFRDALGDWRVSGPIDAVAHWYAPAGDGGAATARLDTVAHLDGASITHPRFPVAFDKVKATIEIDDERVRSDGLSAMYGPAAIDGDVEIGRSSGAGRLALRITGLPLDAAVLEALPAELRGPIKGVQPSGALDVSLDDLRYAPREGGGSTWTLGSGRMRLHDVAVKGDLGLSHLAGDVMITGQIVDRGGGMTLAGEARLDSLEFLSRTATELHGDWKFVRTAGGEGQFELRDVRGDLYGGLLMAEEISLRFSPERASYFVKATARKVELEPFVNADYRAGADKPFEGGGWLDAQLSLVGEVGRTPSRRGTGGFEIRDAAIYRLPVVLAILNFIDPTTGPSPEAFNFAKARFSVVGTRMDLADVLLTGPAMTFIGSGWFSMNDRHINLELDPRSRRAWSIPVLTPMVDGTARRLVSISVTGPLSQPVVGAKSLPDVNDAFKDIFRRKKGTRYSSNSNP